MSKQAKSRPDLIAIVTIDEHGDGLVIIKKDNGTIDQVLKEKALGTSITFESVTHPAYGEIVIPHLRRGFKQCNTEVMRCLLQ